MALSLFLLAALPIFGVFGAVSMDYRRNNQHVTIDRDGSQIDVRFGDILEVNGRKMSYIGNEQWMGEDSKGEWDPESIQQMPASYFLSVTHFRKTGNRISPDDIAKLSTSIKGWSDSYGAETADSGERLNPTVYNFDHSRILYIAGRAVQIFLTLYLNIIAAVVSFVVALFLGYSAMDWYYGRGMYGKEKGSAVIQFVDSDDSERAIFVPPHKHGMP